ncbi:hypothetical protein HK102_008998 [Quaeritorhiza haematococci]|nr:hypothetical protein HK102_008998 [Quaeritorhiza haematococci]
MTSSSSSLGLHTDDALNDSNTAEFIFSSPSDPDPTPAMGLGLRTNPSVRASRGNMFRPEPSPFGSPGGGHLSPNISPRQPSPYESPSVHSGDHLTPNTISKFSVSTPTGGAASPRTPASATSSITTTTTVNNTLADNKNDLDYGSLSASLSVKGGEGDPKGNNKITITTTRASTGSGQRRGSSERRDNVDPLSQTLLDRSGEGCDAADSSSIDSDDDPSLVSDRSSKTTKDDDQSVKGAGIGTGTAKVVVEGEERKSVSERKPVTATGVRAGGSGGRPRSKSFGLFGKVQEKFKPKKPGESSIADTTGSSALTDDNASDRSVVSNTTTTTTTSTAATSTGTSVFEKITKDTNTNASIARAMLLPQPVKVKVHDKKDREFSHLMLIQELEVGGVVGTGSSESIPDDTRHPQQNMQTNVDDQGAGPIWALKFSDDGRYLASCGQDCDLRIWILVSEVSAGLGADSGDVGGVGRRSVAATDPSSGNSSSGADFRNENMDRGRPSVSASSATQQSSSTFSSAPGASTSRTYPPSHSPIFRRKPYRIYRGHTEPILDITWSRHNFIATASMDKTVRLWHISRPECLCAFTHLDIVTSARFHPLDDRFLLTGSLDSRIRIWSIQDKRVLHWNELPNNSYVTAVGFTRDGSMCVAGTWGGDCVFYEFEGLKYNTQIQVQSTSKKKSGGGGGIGAPSTSAASTAGNAASGGTGTGTGSGRLRGGVTGGTGPVGPLPTGVGKSRCKITGIEPLPLGTILPGDPRHLDVNSTSTSLAASVTTEDRILVTSNDSRIRLYNLRDKSLYRKYKGLENRSSQIRAGFSDDGRLIVCGSEDKNVYLWNTDPPSQQVVSGSSSSVGAGVAGDLHHPHQFSGMGVLSNLMTSWQSDVISKSSAFEKFAAVGKEDPGVNVTCAVFAPRKTRMHLENAGMRGKAPGVGLGVDLAGGHIVVVADSAGRIRVYENEMPFNQSRLLPTSPPSRQHLSSSSSPSPPPTSMTSPHEYHQQLNLNTSFSSAASFGAAALRTAPQNPVKRSVSSNALPVTAATNLGRPIVMQPMQPMKAPFQKEEDLLPSFRARTLASSTSMNQISAFAFGSGDAAGSGGNERVRQSSMPVRGANANVSGGVGNINRKIVEEEHGEDDDHVQSPEATSRSGLSP